MLDISDVRAEMPNYDAYKDWQRDGEILGIAVHHSATADRVTGAPLGTAATFFNYHVNVRGWAHGGYNYVITGQGQIEYALDDKISAYHAGFKDPDNSEGLEFGQFWNNHYIAICLSGWFSEGRNYTDSDGNIQPIPNDYTAPTEAQMQSLIGLVQYLQEKYNISIENVRGHRELAGNSTSCPGANLNPAEFRATLRDLVETPEKPNPEIPSEVEPGHHVLLLPDTDQYFQVSLTYVWKFEPDVSFAVDEAKGRWDYVTALGDADEITDTQLAQLRSSGAKLVQRIPGDPTTVQATLDNLVAENMRFLVTSEEPEPDPEPEPEPEWGTYTVQPGDTLSAIARQVYGQSTLWRIIFEANRDTLSDPSRIRVGQVLKIPPQ